MGWIGSELTRNNDNRCGNGKTLQQQIEYHCAISAYFFGNLVYSSYFLTPAALIQGIHLLPGQRISP